MARPRQRRGPRGVFADRLRAARAARGLTQETAAREIGVSRVALALWEAGARRPGDLVRRYVELWIAGALGEPVEMPGRGTK